MIQFKGSVFVSVTKSNLFSRIFQVVLQLKYSTLIFSAKSKGAAMTLVTLKVSNAVSCRSAASTVRIHIWPCYDWTG